MKKLFIVLIASLSTFATFAQKAKVNEPTTSATITTLSNYNCPMHSGVVSNEAGKCIKCNMDLMLSTKEHMKKDVMKDYRCPMHKEVVNNIEGTCAKCGKTLVVADRTGSKHAHTTYVCSMHPDVIADKSGKCPKCGMDLTKTKSKTKKG